MNHVSKYEKQLSYVEKMTPRWLTRRQGGQVQTFTVLVTTTITKRLLLMRSCKSEIN